MILVKNVNVFFVIVVVVILNLINGLQFNQTPSSEKIITEPVANDITNKEPSRPHVIGQEELSPTTLPKSPDPTPGHTHSELDMVTDFDDLTEEEKKIFLETNASKSSSSNSDIGQDIDSLKKQGPSLPPDVNNLVQTIYVSDENKNSIKESASLSESSTSEKVSKNDSLDQKPQNTDTAQISAETVEKLDNKLQESNDNLKDKQADVGESDKVSDLSEVKIKESNNGTQEEVMKTSEASTTTTEEPNITKAEEERITVEPSSTSEKLKMTLEEPITATAEENKITQELNSTSEEPLTTTSEKLKTNSVESITTNSEENRITEELKPTSVEENMITEEPYSTLEEPIITTANQKFSAAVRVEETTQDSANLEANGIIQKPAFKENEVINSEEGKILINQTQTENVDEKTSEVVADNLIKEAHIESEENKSDDQKQINNITDKDVESVSVADNLSTKTNQEDELTSTTTPFIQIDPLEVNLDYLANKNRINNRFKKFGKLYDNLKKELAVDQLETQPENKLETQTEHQPENQLEAQPENKLETQTEHQPENQLETQPEHQPENQLETQPEHQPENQLETEPEHQTENQLENKSEAQQEHQSENQTEDQPKDRSGHQPEHQVEAQPEHQIEAQLEHQSEDQSEHQSEDQSENKFKISEEQSLLYENNIKHEVHLQSSETESTDKNRLIHNFNKSTYPSKYCAELKPIKDLLNIHIETFYAPIISKYRLFNIILILSIFIVLINITRFITGRGTNFSP